MQIKNVHLTSFAILLTLSLGFESAAQSPLSTMYPLGLPLQNATGPSQALGGSGTGVINDYYGMAENPANLGGMTKSAFSAITSLDLLSLREGDKSTDFATLSPMLLSFAFPLKAAGTFAVSIDRRNDVRLKYRTRNSVAFETGEIDTIDFGIMKNGGLTAWQAGWGYAIGRWATVGISYERLYLLSNEITMWRVGLEGRQANSFPLFDTTLVTLRANALRGGIQVPFNKLTVGVAGEYILAGDAKRTVASNHPDTVFTASERFSLHLPPSLDIGASYAFSPRWFAAVSGGVMLWRNYESGVELGQLPEDAWSLGCGGQFIPAPNLLVPRYWEIIQYRAGFRYAQLPTATGSEMAFTVGLGLPFSQGTGLFDIFCDIGRRTDTGFEEYSENFIAVKIGFNGGKKWFQNTGIRY